MRYKLSEILIGILMIPTFLVGIILSVVLMLFIIKLSFIVVKWVGIIS